MAAVAAATTEPPEPPTQRPKLPRTALPLNHHAALSIQPGVIHPENSSASVRAARALPWLCLAGTMLHGLRTIGIVGGPAVLFDAWIYLAIMGLAALACLVRAACVRHDRVAWALIAAASGAYLLASVYWQAGVGPVRGEPSPSLADAGWLVFYPLAYAGVILLIRARIPRFTTTASLDGLIAGLAVAALVAAVLFDGVTTGARGDVATVATNLAYPIGDLLLLAFVVGGCSVAGWRMTRAWTLLSASLAALAIADALYLYAVATQTYHEGAPLDTLWPLGMTLLAMSAWAPAPAHEAPVKSDGRVSLFLTLGFTVLAVCLLLMGLVGGTVLSPVAAAAAALTLVAAFVRTALAFTEIARLAETRQEAVTDDLTGLPNRRLLYREARAAVARAQQTGDALSVLLIDLDGFKEINDTLGHAAGDELLRGIGPRLRSGLREGDLLARLGGDEFAVLMPGMADATALAVAQRLRRSLQEPFRIQGLALVVDASAGVASFPRHGRSVEELIQHADVAMYQAKGTRSGAEIYAYRRDSSSRDRLTLLSDLRSGLDRGEIVVHYQPQADARSRGVVGAEALVRWRHPALGLLAPGRFLGAAEQTGLMRPLTLEVLDQAVSQVTEWRRDGLALSVSVNLAAVNMLDRELPAEVDEVLRRHAADPAWLVVEVTESVVMTDAARAADVLGELRSMGLAVALDDFGTGHSSLALLETLPVDELKIDRGFVRDMATKPSTSAIVRATLEMARALGLRTVAEGVEDDETWHRLEAAGCDRVQGFALSRPVPSGELVAWLDARSPAVRPSRDGGPAGTLPPARISAAQRP